MPRVFVIPTGAKRNGGIPAYRQAGLSYHAESERSERKSGDFTIDSRLRGNDSLALDFFSQPCYTEHIFIYL